MKRHLGLISVSVLLLLALCAASALAKEKPAYEKFAYSLPAEANWTNTLTYIDVGEVIRFDGSGAIRPAKESPLIGPSGLGDDGAGPGFKCPELPAYSLISRIGRDGDCFLIGDEAQATPRKPGFLYFGINSKKSPAKKGSAGKFEIVVEILRPTCGDDICEEGEQGYCKADCDWCGDGACNANETCRTCSKDCGFCEGDIEAAEEKTKRYFELLQANDFTGLADISSGDFRAYYDEFKRFKREFKKAVDMLGIEKENELLPGFRFGTVNVTIDEMRDHNAIVNATVDDKLYRFKLAKEDDEWKLTDMKDMEDEEWFTEDLDLRELRDNHNEYLGRITEDEGLTPEEIEIDATTTKASAKLVIWTVVIILLFFGALYFVFIVLKKRKNLNIFKKIKISRGPRIKKQKKTEKSERPRKEEQKREEQKKEKDKNSETGKKKSEEPGIPAIQEQSKCPKCGAEVFAHERFCVKCGTKLKKKR